MDDPDLIWYLGDQDSPEFFMRGLKQEQAIARD